MVVGAQTVTSPASDHVCLIHAYCPICGFLLIIVHLHRVIVVNVAIESAATCTQECSFKPKAALQQRGQQ